MQKLFDKNFFTKRKSNRKILLTLFFLFLFRFGNSIPINGIDQEALSKSFLEFGANNKSIMQIINMYSGGVGNAIITPFSLGIIPFINASIFIDLLTAIIPQLEKLQSEEGEAGRKKLTLYKKIVTFLFAIGQSLFLVFSLKDYLYNINFFIVSKIILELVAGSMMIIWISNSIDNKGIGNGTSLIIFTNIILNFFNRTSLSSLTYNNSIFFELLFLLLIVLLICISQTARVNIEVVSARQLAFLENLEKNSKLNIEKNKSFQAKDNGLAIRLNQAGIFPIIIASNLLPFFSYLLTNYFGKYQNIESFVYYIFIISFNYFYTIVFWDPEKISEQLRKASVSIINITPGKETISYLENVVKSTSIIGGIFLCLILFFYDFIKKYFFNSLLSQINISSLIILVGVSYELQKNLRSIYRDLSFE